MSWIKFHLAHSLCSIQLSLKAKGSWVRAFIMTKASGKIFILFLEAFFFRSNHVPLIPTIQQCVEGRYISEKPKQADLKRHKRNKSFFAQMLLITSVDKIYTTAFLFAREPQSRLYVFFKKKKSSEKS